MPMVETEEQTMLRDMARGFLDENAPVAALRKLRDEADPDGFDRGLWREMAQMGWAGVLVGEDQGGSGLGAVEAAIIAEEMGKTLAASPFLSTSVMAATVLQAANDADWPGRIAAGEAVLALAVDETRKHDPATVRTEAVAQGNGFRLSGAKSFVADGHVADRLIVSAQADEGVTLFLVDPSAKGVEVERTVMVDSRNAARITLRDVEADGDDVLGEVGGGAALLARGLNAGRAGLAAELSGVAQGAFGMTAQYLKDRTQFGQAIGAFQALQHRAAHLYAEIEITRSAVLNAAQRLNEDPGRAEGAVSLAKARATETAKLAVSEGVQMHGGVGMTDAFDIGLYMKRARVGAEWLGDYGYHAGVVARLRGF